MPGDRQHYLPATVIAGFGRRVGGRARRDSDILVKDLATGTISVSTAANEAHRQALYRLTAPPPGIGPDWVDERWSRIENALPNLVERLVNKALVAGDDEMLIAYAAMVGVRHPSFKAIAEAHQEKHGMPAPTADVVNIMRIEGILNGIAKMTDWRWRVLHTTAGDSPFMLSDRGWMAIREINGALSIWVPMAPTAGILGYLEDERFGPRRPPFEEQRDIVPSWVTWLNAATGDDTTFTHSLFTHPDNRRELEDLPVELARQQILDGQRLALSQSLQLGDGTRPGTTEVENGKTARWIEPSAMEPSALTAERIVSRTEVPPRRPNVRNKRRGTEKTRIELHSLRPSRLRQWRVPSQEHADTRRPQSTRGAFASQDPDLDSEANAVPVRLGALSGVRRRLP